MIQLSSKTRRFFPEIKATAQSEGLYKSIVVLANRVRRGMTRRVRFYFCYYFNKFLRSRATFRFQGKRYRYFVHKYNATWRNERSIEIPIVESMMHETRGDVLEIGNVISHYFKAKHDIVDKYERAEGVTAQDVTEIQTTKRYDLIVSISTLEHVGWDEKPDHSEHVDDPEKILKAISRLCTLLKPHGKIVVTLPLGYNPYLDNLLKTRRLKFDRQFFMKRAFCGCKWVEGTWNEVKAIGFNMQVPTANALLIGIFEN